MKAFFQDLFLHIPLYQLTFITPLPKEEVYYDTVVSCIPNQWFESPTLLAIENEEECRKLNNDRIVNQLIQDANLIGMVICVQNLPIHEDFLSLLRACQVPIVQVEDPSALSLFHQRTIPQNSYSRVSMELYGFMNKGFMNIASNLSIALETPFLYLDANNQLLWQIGSDLEIEKALQWLKLYCKENKNGSLFKLSVPTNKSLRSTTKTTISFEKYTINIAGQINITLVAKRDLVEWQKRIIDKFIGLTALFFQTEEMFREQQERMKEHFVYELLYRKFESKNVMIKQGKAWGWNLDKSHHLFVINVALSNELMTNMEWMDEMIVHLETQLPQLKKPIIIFPFQEQIVVLLEDGENRTPSERKNFAIEIASMLEKELTSNWPVCQFKIGIGKWYQDPVNLNKSYQEAKIALQFGEIWFENKRVFHMNDLGIFHLLIHIHREILYDFSQEYLSTLIESDQEYGTEYVKTLKAYIQYHGIISEVSDALYVHPNTLRNRLKKIEDMTGVHLQNPVEFMNLMVAVKIHFSMFL